MIHPLIKEKIEQRLKRRINTPADCEALSKDIEAKTGEHLGVNTLKRLMGMLGTEVEPRQTTLNILAKYLGYTNWLVLKLIANNEGNSDFDGGFRILPAQLKVGQVVRFTYDPDREVEVTYLGDEKFRVTDARRSKMMVGDILFAQQFVLGQPLICTVERELKSLGTLTAGKLAGLTSLKCK